MESNVLPEEKLLRLIRGEKKAKSKNTNLSYPSRRYLSFISLQSVMMALLFLSFTYLAISFVYSWVSPGEVKLPVKQPQKTGTPNYILSKEQIKPFEFYARNMNQRQLFGSPVKNNADIALIATADALKELTLVGIISGANPQAIIEDKKTAKIYYVTKGQLVGGYHVEDIQEGKIILNYNGQKYELYI